MFRVTTCILLALAFAAGMAGCGSEKKSTAPGHPTVEVLAPNGGEQLSGGVAYAVTWSAADPDTPAEELRIALEYSTDGGSIWVSIAQDRPNAGSFDWSVPPVTTNAGRVRITASDGTNQASDASDASFTIVPAPPYVLTIGSATGLPSAEVPVPLALANAGAVRLIHADLRYDPSVATFIGAETTERAEGMELITLPAGDGLITIDLQAAAPESLPAGEGAVARLTFRLTGANHTETSLTLEGTLLLGAGGDTLQTQIGAGLLRIDSTGDDLIREGWRLFTAGDLIAAEQAFDAAVADLPQSGEAYTGQGWCRLGLATGSAGLERARASFDSALARGWTGADVRSGRAATSLGLGGAGLAEAAADADSALRSEPEFVFPHRTSFDAGDLRLIQAFARTGLGDIDGALAAADAVEPSGIRRDDPASWRVGGVAYAAFEAAVLADLHQLSAAYSG